MSAISGKPSVSTGILIRDIILEHQIRTRGLPFHQARKSMGHCCLTGVLMKLTPLGRCHGCTAELAAADCACTKKTTCVYHDWTRCYHCGVSILEPHRAPCA